MLTHIKQFRQICPKQNIYILLFQSWSQMENNISKAKLNKLVNKVFPKSKIKSIFKFQEGLINKTYHLKIINPSKELVLRIYPHENWKAEKEAYLYGLLSKKTRVPVPQVHLCDSTKAIFPYSYNLLDFVEGENLSEVYKKKFEPKLAFQAGKILAKIHTVKFDKYGWIIGDKIRPSFERWIDFMKYDIQYKIKKLKTIPRLSKFILKNANAYIKENINRLDFDPTPSLIHKDYHLSHIIVKDGKINGIIDWEWALSGDKLLDFIKPHNLMFNKYPKMIKPFYNGYNQIKSFSPEQEKRFEIYNIISLVGMVNFAYERRNKNFYDKYTKELMNILKK